MNRQVRALLLIFILGLILMSCLERDTDAWPENGVRAQLRFFWWGELATHEKYDKLIQQFEQQHPDIRVEGQAYSWQGYWDHMRGHLKRQTLPDVFLMAQQELASFVEQNALLPLDRYMEAGLIDTEKIDPKVLKLGQYEGQTYMIAKTLSATAIIVNRDLLMQRNIPLPEQNMDWEQFAEYVLRIAPMLNSDKPHETLYVLGDSGAQEIAFFSYLLQQGKSFITPDGKQLGFTYEDVKRWFEWWGRLRDAGAVSPPDPRIISKRTDLNASRLTKQQVVMEIAAGAELKRWQAEMEEDLDLLMLPQTEGADAILETKPYGEWIEGTYFAISAHTRHPEAAARFIDYWLNDHEWNRLYDNEHGIISNQELLNRMQLHPSDQKTAAHLHEVLDRVIVQTPQPPSSKALFALLQQSYYEWAAGKISLEEALSVFFQKSAQMLDSDKNIVHESIFTIPPYISK